MSTFKPEKMKISWEHSLTSLWKWNVNYSKHRVRTLNFTATLWKHFLCCGFFPHSSQFQFPLSIKATTWEHQPWKSIQYSSELSRPHTRPFTGWLIINAGKRKGCRSVISRIFLFTNRMLGLIIATSVFVVMLFLALIQFWEILFPSSFLIFCLNSFQRKHSIIRFWLFSKCPIGHQCTFKILQRITTLLDFQRFTLSTLEFGFRFLLLAKSSFYHH